MSEPTKNDEDNGMNNTEAAAAAKVLVLCEGTEQERTFLVNPLTDQDFATVNQWVADQMPSAVESIIPTIRNLSRAEREIVLREAARIQAGGGEPPTARAIAKHINTPTGCAFLAWISVRAAHPDVTLEELKKLITKENYRDVYTQLGKVAGLEGKDPGPKPSTTG